MKTSCPTAENFKEISDQVTYIHAIILYCQLRTHIVKIFIFLFDLIFHAMNVCQFDLDKKLFYTFLKA